MATTPHPTNLSGDRQAPHDAARLQGKVEVLDHDSAARALSGLLPVGATRFWAARSTRTRALVTGIALLAGLAAIGAVKLTSPVDARPNIQ